MTNLNTNYGFLINIVILCFIFNKVLPIVLLFYYSFIVKYHKYFANFSLKRCSSRTNKFSRLHNNTSKKWNDFERFLWINWMIIGDNATNTIKNNLKVTRVSWTKSNSKWPVHFHDAGRYQNKVLKWELSDFIGQVALRLHCLM